VIENSIPVSASQIRVDSILQIPTAVEHW